MDNGRWNNNSFFFIIFHEAADIILLHTKCSNYIFDNNKSKFNLLDTRKSWTDLACERNEYEQSEQLPQ